ncbi:MAG TPA: ABC transporter substrate-binding protein [Gaiellales bacterium]|jgi:iron complex transport system substrate-binding protein
MNAPCLLALLGSHPPRTSPQRYRSIIYADLLRVCSLLPSATEIVAALGCADLVVGRSAECDYPTEVGSLPVVTAARIDSATLRGRDIDAAVRAAVLDGRPLYALDEDLIRRLAPDLVITQDLCHVCAVSSDEVSRVHSLDAEVLALDPRTLTEVAESVRTVARRLGVPQRGDEVADAMEARIAATRQAVAGMAPVRVFVAEWLDPPFAAGHWLPEMVAAAGGAEVLGQAGLPSYPTTWEAVAAAEPELVVAAACGFDATRIAAEAAGLALPCRTVAVDANAYYSRPAPRLAEGVAQLAHLMHPDAAPDPGLPAIEIEPAWTR